MVWLLHELVAVPVAQAGIHIVTPNKKLNSGPLPQYQALRQFQRGSYIHFFYEVQCPGLHCLHWQCARMSSTHLFICAQAP